MTCWAFLSTGLTTVGKPTNTRIILLEAKGVGASKPGGWMKHALWELAIAHKRETATRRGQSVVQETDGDCAGPCQDHHAMLQE